MEEDDDDDDKAIMCFSLQVKCFFDVKLQALFLKLAHIMKRLKM